MKVIKSKLSKKANAARRKSGRTLPTRRGLERKAVVAVSKGALVPLASNLQAQDASGEEASHAASGARPTESAARPRARSLIISESVRSGQTVEFLEGDVTVIGSVGSGAEIVAGGSIHVYGTLRGRALAGTAGDPTARIFCRSLQAELLSIDGKYRVAENFEDTLWGRPVQARLEGIGMTFALLD